MYMYLYASITVSLIDFAPLTCVVPKDEYSTSIATKRSWSWFQVFSSCKHSAKQKKELLCFYLSLWGGEPCLCSLFIYNWRSCFFYHKRTLFFFFGLSFRVVFLRPIYAWSHGLNEPDQSCGRDVSWGEPRDLSQRKLEIIMLLFFC